MIKNKLIKIFFLLILLLFAALFLIRRNSYSEHKILKVIEADKFYIDINDNNKIDENELFKLRDVDALTPVMSYDSYKKSQTLNIPYSDYLKTGYLARNWAVDNLTNKSVLITYKSDNIYKATPYRLVSFKFDSKDYALVLLEYGFGFAFDDCKNIDYLNYTNLKQIKKNSLLLSKINFVILNLKTNIVHKLNCKYFDFINSGELINYKFNKFSPCRVCFSLNSDKETNQQFEFSKSKNSYPKSISKRFGNIELFLINPLEYNRPNCKCVSEFCKRLVNLIDNSKESIDIALYGINEQDEIFDALKRAKNRGVKIRTVVDYSKNMNNIYPDTQKFIKEFDSRTDKTEAIMHNKFFIFDNHLVLSGTSNISSSGSGGYNSNNMILIDSSDIASIYKQEFEQMYDNNFSKKKRKVNSKPISLDNSVISVYFSPRDDILNSLLLPEIKSGKSEIFISAFYLTDINLIDELIKARKRGVNILIIMDALGAINFRERINKLRAENISVIVENWGGKNHDKTMVIDSKIFISGSCNFSKSGFYKNDENVIMIKNEKIASFYRDYFLYLFNSIDRKYLSAFPLAESFESKNSCYDGIDNNHDGMTDGEDKNCSKTKK